MTDGPFTETKELIAGFALFEVQSKDEAVEWTKRFLRVAGEGESEIREIFEGNCPPDHASLREDAVLQREPVAASR